MSEAAFQIHQLIDEIQPPDSGKQILNLLDDDNEKLYCTLLPLATVSKNTSPRYQQSFKLSKAKLN